MLLPIFQAKNIYAQTTPVDTFQFKSYEIPGKNREKIKQQLKLDTALNQLTVNKLRLPPEIKIGAFGEILKPLEVKMFFKTINEQNIPIPQICRIIKEITKGVRDSSGFLMTCSTAPINERFSHLEKKTFDGLDYYNLGEFQEYFLVYLEHHGYFFSPSLEEEDILSTKQFVIFDDESKKQYGTGYYNQIKYIVEFNLSNGELTYLITTKEDIEKCTKGEQQTINLIAQSVILEPPMAGAINWIFAQTVQVTFKK